MEGRDPSCGAHRSRWTRGGLRFLVVAWLAFGMGSVGAQDTPEMLAAMRAALPAVPEEVPDFAALPPELRRQIPPIRIQVHRWHDDPEKRYVQIDGRRVAEDGVAGQELWLRRIRRDAVVMQFRSSLFVYPLKVAH